MTGVYLFCLAVSVIALALVAFLYNKVKCLPEGNEDMVEKARIIREGADAFLTAEYKVIVPAVAVIAIIFSLLIEKTLGLAVIWGAIMSSLACIVGMKGAVLANVRTTNTAREALDLGSTMQVALKGGSIAGFAVQGFALLGFSIMQLVTGGSNTTAAGHGFLLNVLCNPTLHRIAAFSAGCSAVAMFNRVAGGNYTKAADISADTVGKVRFALANIQKKFANYCKENMTKQLREILEVGLEEDSFLNPSVLADFIGDNVNDIAGNCSDLLESFIATISASFLISSFVCIAAGNPLLFDNFTMYPVLLATSGLVSSMLGLPLALRKEAAARPAKALSLFSSSSAVLSFILSIVAAFVCFGNGAVTAEFKLGWISPVIASLTGIASGIAIGRITEYYTATEYRPVKRLAGSAKEGAAFVITIGDALGSHSCLPVIGTISLALLISDLICGDYGTAVASLGMLSFVATTVSVDAFGPIADNAGGLAEACELNPKVREITDHLDALGNTTAAQGKGYAICSAAFATVSLIKAFTSSYADGSEAILNAASTRVVIGFLLGAAIIEFFIALLTYNTIDSATKMADESEKELMDGVLAGTKKPDYVRIIKMAAEEALRKMALPSVIALVIPIVVGLLFGNQVLGGLLIGATIVAIPRAIFMGNSGGAYDNGKKAIETGQVQGARKGDEAHVAAVVGDTVGDTRKDVVGVALDIFIKMMSTIANIIAPFTQAFHLL